MGTPAPQAEQAGSATQRALAMLERTGDTSIEAFTQAFANAGATVIVSDAQGTRRVQPEADA